MSVTSRQAPADREPRPCVDVVLPHARPMILIEDVSSRGPGNTRSTVRIHEGTMFCEAPHGVPAYVGLEYIAQTVAAHAGLRAHRAGEPVRVGFLLGTRRYDCAVAHFPLGSELTIDVVATLEGETISKFAGVIVDASTGNELARCAVTVYVRRGVAGEP